MAGKVHSRAAVFVMACAAQVSLAEEVTIPLVGLEGDYYFYDSRIVDVELGFALYRINGARIEWSGEAAAGYGWENGVECPGQWVIAPARFEAYLNDPDYKAHAYGPALGESTYPSPEPFNTASQFELAIGGTWNFLLDGRCEGKAELHLAYPVGFCTLDLYEYASGVLSDAELVIVGQRAGDFDADADVDLQDFAQFGSCFTGCGGGPLEPACKPGDFDRDDDIDCDDWEAFKRAWTEADDPPIFLPCSSDSIPTISEWGVVLMTLLLLTAWVLVFRRAQTTDTR